MLHGVIMRTSMLCLLRFDHQTFQQPPICSKAVQHHLFDRSTSTMAGGKTIEVKSQAEWEAEHAKAKAEDKVVVVDFWADWCGPCKMIAGFYAELSEKYTNIVFLKVDVDAALAIATMCGIAAMPTFQVYKDGVKVDELVGAAKEKLEAMVQKHATAINEAEKACRV